MVDGGSFSYAGSGRSLAGMRRHFMVPGKVLWRRWRFAQPLATIPTTLFTLIGVYSAPPGFTTGSCRRPVSRGL